jgi:tetratricopeptide (TPR) repeat protein
VAIARSRTLGDPKALLNDIAASIPSDAGRACARARAVVRDYPESPQAQRVLALALRRLGNISEAERVELKAIELGLRLPAAVAAEKALADGKLEDAELAIRPYLRENPDDAGAALILGTIAQRCGAPKEAENLFRRSALLAPSYFEARILLAKLFNETGRFEEALVVLDEILERDRKHLATLTLKAGLLVQYRRLDEAITVYRRLIRAHPGDVLGWLNYAYILKTAGHVGDAISAYRQVLQIDPARGVAWWAMGNLKTFKFQIEDVESMRRGLDRDDVDDDNRIHLHFALGKALGDQGEYEEAFAHYRKASELRRAKSPHNAQIVHANVLTAEKTFTPEFFAATAGAGYLAADSIFVVSMPRSGSTLIEQILASHPAIEGTEELFDMGRIAGEMAPDETAGAYMGKITSMSSPELWQLGKGYIEATRRFRQTDRPYFTDKMPSNWALIGLIHTILPNAKIIDVRRHPLGCGFANFAQHYNWGINFSYDLNDLGEFYSDYVRQMAHFDRVLPGLVHRIFYEDLIEDLEGEVRRMLDYLGLPFDPACLRFFENKRAVHTPSSEQVRRPINRDGMTTWRNYEPWLGPLKEALGPVLDLYPDVPSEWPE